MEKDCITSDLKRWLDGPVVVIRGEVVGCEPDLGLALDASGCVLIPTEELKGEDFAEVFLRNLNKSK